MDAAATAPLPPVGGVLETPHARVHVVAAGAPLPDGCEVAFPVTKDAAVAYAPRAPGAAAARMVAPDASLAGNAFRALHESERALAALVSVAAGRRMESGPQSERVLVYLRGNGLVFLENGDTQRYRALDASVVPAGEAVRVWAQGPEDALAVVLQPAMEAQPRRTLASEVAKLRQRSAGGSGSA